jgi:hypothetical protein
VYLKQPSVGHSISVGLAEVMGVNMSNILKDDRLLHVAEEKLRLMREFGDLVFEEADQAVIDAKHKEYMAMKQLDREGVTFVTKF